MHLIRANYAPDLSSVTLAVPGDRRNVPARTFPFPKRHEDAAEWFSVYFEQQILVRHSPEGFPDDNIANGQQLFPPHRCNVYARVPRHDARQCAPTLSHDARNR